MVRSEGRVSVVCCVLAIATTASTTRAQERVAVLGLEAPPDLLEEAEALAFGMEDAVVHVGASVLPTDLAIDAAMERAGCTVADTPCLRAVSGQLDADIVVFGFLQREAGDPRHRVTVIRVYDRCAGEIRSAVTDSRPDSAFAATMRLLEEVPQPPSAEPDVPPDTVTVPAADDNLDEWAIGLGLGSLGALAGAGALLLAVSPSGVDDGLRLGASAGALALTIGGAASAVSAAILAILAGDEEEPPASGLRVTPELSANGAGFRGALRF